ncbi:MAG: prepilin-type N-terminal cleavage/methylation domain-containing protein [Bacillota bacterium]|nr:prepilin-type N-terminal cleavage/methylation domain-containing protein [Bacillota bacterium]
MKRFLPEEDGFTLVETLLSLSILVIVLLGILGFYDQGYLYWSQADEKYDLQENLAAAVEDITKNLRQAAGVTEAADGTTLVYQVDIDSNGTPDETHRYVLGSDAVLRWEKVGGSTSEEIAGHIKTLAFTYYVGGNTPVASPGSHAPEVTRIDVRLTGKAGTYETTVETSVTLRVRSEQL